MSNPFQWVGPFTIHKHDIPGQRDESFVITDSRGILCFTLKFPAETTRADGESMLAALRAHLSNNGGYHTQATPSEARFALIEKTMGQMAERIEWLEQQNRKL